MVRTGVDALLLSLRATWRGRQRAFPIDGSTLSHPPQRPRGPTDLPSIGISITRLGLSSPEVGPRAHGIEWRQVCVDNR
jgi:hypothetical protein